MTPALRPPGIEPPRERPGGRVPPPPPPAGDGGDDEREPAPQRPWGISNAMLAMLFLISAELMFFAGLVSGYFVLRTAAPVWPPPLQPRLPVVVTGLNTLVLLGSSVLMVQATRALGVGTSRAVARRLLGAAALGAVFLAVQGTEWVRLVHFGLTLSSGAYGATFYTLIGVHAAHVLGALVWLITILALAWRGHFTAARPAPVRACALYWHFVVALWPFLYLTVYLL